MVNQVLTMTKEGYENLEKELNELITVKRVEVKETLKEARSQGDLSENAEYDAAKDEQGKLEKRIADIEAMLKIAQIVDESEISTDKVSVGSYVTVKNMKREKVDTYKIVGSAEANTAKKRISDESPVGKALLGHKVGDTVEAETPSGNVPYEILEINRTDEAAQ